MQRGEGFCSCLMLLFVWMARPFFSYAPSPKYGLISLQVTVSLHTVADSKHLSQCQTSFLLLLWLHQSEYQLCNSLAANYMNHPPFDLYKAVSSVDPVDAFVGLDSCMAQFSQKYWSKVYDQAVTLNLHIFCATNWFTCNSSSAVVTGRALFSNTCSLATTLWGL